MVFDEKTILEYLKTHREVRAEYHKLEAKRRRCGADMQQCEQERLRVLADKYDIVEEWLSMLPDDKEFVIRRHLIDELDFKRIEAEHIEKWHEFGKSERTLRRYQKIALERIMRYANTFGSDSAKMPGKYSTMPSKGRLVNQ